MNSELKEAIKDLARKDVYTLTQTEPEANLIEVIVELSETTRAEIQSLLIRYEPEMDPIELTNAAEEAYIQAWNSSIKEFTGNEAEVD